MSIILTLSIYGEPRRRNNETHGFMMFPLYQISSGTVHNIILTEKEKLYSWGSSEYKDKEIIYKSL